MKQHAFLVATCFIAVATLLFGQAPKKAAPGRLPEKPDTWQRSKECATQAEKMMADRDARLVAGGGLRAESWTNHYSPKYARCFVSAHYANETSARLIDAFERVEVAATISELPKPQKITCQTPEELADCEGLREAVREAERALWGTLCNIDGKPADCAKAKEFIEDHMRN
jgi:hypothetical protein